MSRTTRGNARRRLSLLATSSFVATSLLSGAGVLTATLTPSIALAARSEPTEAQRTASVGFDLNADGAAMIPLTGRPLR